MYSCQIRTPSLRLGIFSCHHFFQFHELENVPAIYVSGKWHQISRLSAPTLFARTIAITLLTISIQYTLIHENLIDVSGYWHRCWSTNTGKMDVDDGNLTDFQFGSSQESEIDPPLVLDSVWDCPGITLNTFVDDDGKTILGWCCSYCLIPGNRDGSRFFKHHNVSKALSHLYRGEGHCHLFWLADYSSKCCPCLNRVDAFKVE